MKRVLQIVDCMDSGGIQAFIMNIYRMIDKEEIQFDFLVFRQRKQLYEDEILALGGKIFKLPSRRSNAFKCRKALNEFFKVHNEYNVVHYHTSSLSFIDPLIVAKKYNIPIRIVHAHSTKAPGNRIHTALHYCNRLRINNIATHFFACGELSAKWMYHMPKENKVVIINNGIKLDDYVFDPMKRDRIRNELNLDDAFVIGHVGRFSAVKNHIFIIKVLERIIQRNTLKNVKLILIGDGEEMEMIKKKATEIGIIDKVLFLGQRNDICLLLQSMDCFLMPSLYEGFPVAALEAQAVGMPCFLSDTITSDVKLKDNVFLLSLDHPIDEWCELIENRHERICNNILLKNNGYDISYTIQQLKNVYLRQ